MYEDFYRLKEEPFRLSPNSKFCFKHPTYKKAFAYMQYALHRGEGFVMVTGQPGTGKTTLINDLTASVSDGLAVFANISSTQLEADDLLRMVAYTFGLDGKTTIKSSLLQDLETFFRRVQANGKRPLLIIDEAQGLPRPALEELRLMTNLQQNNRPLLQIFLVGQEELRGMVMSPQLEQLHQRIVAACHLDPLTVQDTEQYIKHRLTQVEWRNDPQLDPDIFPLIRQFSDGIPRWINLICSRLMLHGMVEELHHLGVPETREVLRGLVDEQLLPSRLSAGGASLLAEINDVATQPAPMADETDAQLAADSGGAAVNVVHIDRSEQVQAPADQTTTPAPGRPAATSPDPGMVQGFTAAADLYNELQPQLAGLHDSEKLRMLLDFLDGKTVMGAPVSLPGAERDALAATGLTEWFHSTLGSFAHAGLSEDMLEMMGLAAWLKQVQPELGKEQLEIIGLAYKHMQSGKQP